MYNTWRDVGKTWVCNKHIPTIAYKACKGDCGVLGCSGVRPPLPPRITATPQKIVRVKPTTNLCSWQKCTRDNGVRATKSGRSKYCSVQCKNSYARHRYKLRQKGLL